MYEHFLFNIEPISGRFDYLVIVMIHLNEALRVVSIKENACIHWFSDNSTSGLFDPTKKDFLG